MKYIINQFSNVGIETYDTLDIDEHLREHLQFSKRCKTSLLNQEFKMQFLYQMGEKCLSMYVQLCLLKSMKE